jgi:hypothetical protein
MRRFCPGQTGLAFWKEFGRELTDTLTEWIFTNISPDR